MLAAGACVYSAYYLSGGREWAPVAWPVVFAALVAGWGNLINDYFDAEIDVVNKPRRPIPSGRLSRPYALGLYAAGTAAISGAMVLSLPGAILAMMLSWEALLFVYAAWGKRVAILGNVLIAAVCASAFTAGAMITGDYEAVVFPAAFAFVFVMGRELVKGAEDVAGDERAGARTLAVRWGGERSARWGALLLFACVAAAPAPAVHGYFTREYGLLAEAAVVPGVLAAACHVLRDPRREVYHLASRILKLEMLAGIVVMGLGRSSF